MKKILFAIMELMLPFACGLFLLTESCSQEDAEETQRKTIESALGTSYTAVDGIYWKRLRHPMCDTIIITERTGAGSGSVEYDTVRTEECKRITAGKIVTFHYSGKVFRGALFVSSKAAEAEAAGFLPQPPQTVTVGQGGLIEGLQRALMQMVEGDSAHVVFPFTLGYGKKGHVGAVPPMSAQEWIIAVKLVE